MGLTPQTIALAKRHFDFLISDCGYRFTPQNDCVRYDAADLYVEIWLGQGDDDFLVGLKKDTAKIRPGMSHLFPFQRLLRHYHQGSFPTLNQFQRAAGISDDEHYLIYVAHWVKRYMLPLLKGDLSVLDQVRS